MDVGRTRVAVTTIPVLKIVYDSKFEDTFKFVQSPGIPSSLELLASVGK